ncbi:MAG TPA: methylated-DNA--[protein]-cysteine S-methyltransferase [Candidatus Acidoferrales bacterium]|nr:methylated-DNA--[protein]-cysteine S-methyltransferase [Candidatus Acidoferrales bacterium]
MNAPFYGVSTTRIYCRTGCKSRRPLARNVRHFANVEDARAAGYRACKRCRPDEVATIHDRVLEACRVLRDAGERMTLAQLGARVGLSPSHLQRLFTQTIGISPRAYAKLAREDLYERPRGDRPGSSVRYAIVDSTLGRVLVAVGPRGVCRVDIDDDDRALERRLRETFPHACVERNDERLTSAASSIVAYLARQGPWPLLPLDVRATSFQLRVWDALRKIRPGATMEYAELARAIGSPSAARAVARACASNPVALLIPCHRIFPAAGGTGGYRWGPRRKARLLELERSALVDDIDVGG